MTQAQVRSLQSYSEGKWYQAQDNGSEVFHAVSGEPVCRLSSSGLDFEAMLEYGRKIGNPKLRAMTFHERARMLKALAQYLMSRKEEFYEISKQTGATRTDSWIDIEGGIGTFFVYASKGRREFPDQPFFVDGESENISKGGTFIGRHLCSPLEGVAVHINAFNFPCWGMLEKLAPTFLAGMPAIVKPASVTAYLAEALVKAMLESEILPPGALQIICGGVGDLFEHLTSQDVVTFTGSANTGLALKAHPNVIKKAVRFSMEADSLNCSILGSDLSPTSEEFGLFIKEVVREVTVKAGQKCTAIRRAMVPADLYPQVLETLRTQLKEIKVGNPEVKGVAMGPLVGKSQLREVAAAVSKLTATCKLLLGLDEGFEVLGADRAKGAFHPITLLSCDNPKDSIAAHSIEAFGPVTTVMPYRTLGEAIELAKLGEGSLVGSLFTTDRLVADEIVHGLASHHGRLIIIDKTCAKESTGHGSPLPHLVHGGPGRAGGGEELGGARSVMHYMQRTALQGSPTTIANLCQEWTRGAATKSDRVHPFRKYFDELDLGETLITRRRTITEADIVSFAAISGDHFYAHTDEIAAKESLFGARVAHGYFVLAAAAGLFVDPAPGPVLANYGLETLRFVKPVFIGDSIYVRLTCKRKTAKEKKGEEKPQGIVAWDVGVFNQGHETVASYTILTLVERREGN